jgi:hypothetical protein
MSVLLVRQKVKEGSVDEAAAVRELFTTRACVPRACATRRHGWGTAQRS